MTSSVRLRTSLRALCQTLAVTLGLLWLAQLLRYSPQTNEGHDFILLYSAAQALHAIRSPYDAAVVAQYAHLAGRAPDGIGRWRGPVGAASWAAGVITKYFEVPAVFFDALGPPEEQSGAAGESMSSLGAALGLL